MKNRIAVTLMLGLALAPGSFARNRPPQKSQTETAQSRAMKSVRRDWSLRGSAESRRPGGRSTQAAK